MIVIECVGSVAAAGGGDGDGGGVGGGWSSEEAQEAERAVEDSHDKSFLGSKIDVFPFDGPDSLQRRLGSVVCEKVSGKDAEM
ncbi:unnamed protein product [Notodromas monacha]|uniref:Uncharacterized protein n=1 Tax=Notodromas monacha TaxID=399045 RepID=A0A7R9BFX3_9CRUS|nr:unnamed protein product [Notodromas monacha]CAG0914537.1 unnamed protein product [Notodromas monacha]